MTRPTLIVGLILALAACSSAPDDSKNAADAKQEQAAARERAKQGPVGDQIRALDKANAVQGTVDQGAQALRDQVDQQSGDAPATAPASAPPP